MPYQRGSGFIGLQQYLNANQEAAKRMGEGLASSVEQQGQAAQSAIDTQQQQDEQAIAAGTPQYTPIPDYTGMRTDDAWAAQVQRGNTPTEYTGPQEMGNMDALGKQALEAQQQAQLAGTEAGRAVLLQQQAKGPYGLGARTLDAFLAGRGAGGRLQAAASRFGDLQRYLSGAQESVAGKVAGAEQTAANVGAQYRAEPKVPRPAPVGGGMRPPADDPLNPNAPRDPRRRTPGWEV